MEFSEEDLLEDVELTLRELRALQLALATGYTFLDHEEALALKQKLSLAILINSEELPELDWMGIVES